MLLSPALRRAALAAGRASGGGCFRPSTGISSSSSSRLGLVVLPSGGAAAAAGAGRRRLLVTWTATTSRVSGGGAGRGVVGRKRPLGGLLPRSLPTTGGAPPTTRGYLARRPSFLPEGEGVVYALIGANVLVFGAWTWASNSRQWTRFMMDHFTVSAAGLEEGRVHTLFTSMFSHKSFGHLLVNCVTLYFFGAEAALLLGARRFLNLYITGGVVSSLGCCAWPYLAPKLDIPASYRVSKWTAALGASGALNAVVAWSILMFPTRMIYVYMVVPVPAALVGVLYLAKDLSGLYRGGGGEANAGHLGGAVVGAAYFFLSRGRGRF